MAAAVAPLAAGDGNIADVDTGDENDEEEYEAWKVRELKRIKRDRDEKEMYVSMAMFLFVGRGSSEVECRTRNRESVGSHPPLLPFRSFGHFCSLHDASVHSAV